MLESLDEGKENDDKIFFRECYCNWNAGYGNSTVSTITSGYEKLNIKEYLLILRIPRNYHTFVRAKVLRAIFWWM
mgnify:CR=1 FL=1